eukprot:COSAG05_NODE_4754_length_1384_cov_5.750195_1_plen_31_part_10
MWWLLGPPWMPPPFDAVPGGPAHLGATCRLS